MNHPNNQTLALDFGLIVKEATNAYMVAIREAERELQASERLITINDDDREEPSHAN